MARPSFLVVRNEPDPDAEYHCDALANRFPGVEEVDYPAGERPDPEEVDAVVLTGSTAGVCFGHQIVNAALGGAVEHVGTTSGLVAADLDDEPLFDGVSPVVPVAHGDAVTETGDGMEVIASAEHCPTFATRHRSAPLWTVQFHPEFTADLRDRLEARFDWTEAGGSFADVNAARVLENFVEVVRERSDAERPRV